MTKPKPREFRTQIGHWRWMKGETQQSMSRKTGIGLRTYRRLENGEMPDPPLGYLVNVALVLDLPLQQICEAGWLAWRKFNADATRPAGRTLKLEAPPRPQARELTKKR